MTPWRRKTLHAAWITLAKLMTLLMARNKKAAMALLRDGFKSRTLPNLLS